MISIIVEQIVASVKGPEYNTSTPNPPAPPLPMSPHLPQLGGSVDDSPIHILQQTATKMSDKLVDAIKEKMQLVQEGQKPGQLPPWGLSPAVAKQPSQDDDGLDSCKEASSQSSMSSSTHEDVSLSPIHSIPIIKLVCDDHLSVTLTDRSDPMYQSRLSSVSGQSDLTDSTLADDLDSLCTSQGTQVSVDSPVGSAQSQAALTSIANVQPIKKGDVVEAIVFSRKPKKHKKKKHKHCKYLKMQI